MQHSAARATLWGSPRSGSPRTGIPCQDHDGELWFSDSPDDVELAKSLCGFCPLFVDCLSGALERGEPWGVWGGQLFAGGRIVATKRRRGRPRKNVAA